MKRGNDNRTEDAVNRLRRTNRTRIFYKISKFTVFKPRILMPIRFFPSRSIGLPYGFPLSLPFTLAALNLHLTKGIVHEGFNHPWWPEGTAWGEGAEDGRKPKWTVPCVVWSGRFPPVSSSRSVHLPPLLITHSRLSLVSSPFTNEVVKDTRRKRAESEEMEAVRLRGFNYKSLFYSSLLYIPLYSLYKTTYYLLYTVIILGFLSTLLLWLEIKLR